MLRPVVDIVAKEIGNCVMVVPGSRAFRRWMIFVSTVLISSCSGSMPVRVCESESRLTLNIGDVSGWFGLSTRPPLQRVEIYERLGARQPYKRVYISIHSDTAKAPRSFAIVRAMDLRPNAEYLLIAQGGPYTGSTTFRLGSLEEC